MKSRNPSVSANAEPAPLAGEPERVIPSRSRPEGKLFPKKNRRSHDGRAGFVIQVSITW